MKGQPVQDGPQLKPTKQIRRRRMIDKPAERKFFFVLTFIMLLFGVLYKVGIF